MMVHLILGLDLVRGDFEGGEFLQESSVLLLIFVDFA